MKTLLLPSQLTKFGRRKDGSVTLSFTSANEVSAEEFGLIDQYYQQSGWLAFKMNEMDISEIPSEKAEVKGQLSPSQSLRHKIFALHMKKGGTKENFTAYYNKVMAGIEQSVIEQIEMIED